MASEPYLQKFTYGDYVRLPVDGRRHEVIDGEHLVAPAPTPWHQFIASNFHRILARFVHERKLGRVCTAPLDVVLSDFDVVQPDLLYISQERLDLVTETNLQGAPDLVIEILSNSTRRVDETAKLDLYDRFGVEEYWMADRLGQAVRVYRRSPAGLRLIAELSARRGDVLTTPLLPGLSIPLEDLFV